MKKDYPLSQIQTLLGPSERLLLLISKNPFFDQVACVLALYLSLTKAGKQVSVVSPDEMMVGFSHLVGLDKVKTNLSNSDFVIDLNYPVENIERIFTTNEEKGNLQIVVRSKPDKESVKKENFSFSSQANLPDLVFTVGARKLEDLGKFYQENRKIFEKPLINIDSHPQNASFGKINLVDLKASCLSEMVVALIVGLKLPFDNDIGNNLILGLKKATDNFQKNRVSADTFEAAALAMKAQEGQAQKLTSFPFGQEASPPPPDQPPTEWLEPKIYKGSTLP